MTAEVRALTGQYGAEAVAVLVHLMRHSDDDRTRLVACKELLDRAYGRPAPAASELTGSGNEPRILFRWQDSHPRPVGSDDNVVPIDFAQPAR